MGKQNTWIFLLFIVFFCGCARHPVTLDSQTFDADTLKMVEDKTCLRLPTGTKGLNLLYHGERIDPSFIAKLKVQEGSHQLVLNELENIRNLSGAISGSHSEEVTWWTPSKGTIYVERLYVTNGCYVHALLSNEKNCWYLYIEWIQI
jgi:hypothetical protein